MMVICLFLTRRQIKQVQTRKEEAMKKYIASFLAICMIFVMVPILPAEAAGLEDTERVEILG